jgi:hypothetical protein
MRLLTGDTNMKLAVILLGLLVAVGAESAAAPEQPAMTPVAKGTNEQVIAYYFHGTVRCETCLRIEKQAREAIEQKFPLEIAAKRIVFKPVNYDKPENAHYMKDYKLPCPSLVLVRQKDGKDREWKLLDKTWEHIENPVKFNEYLVAEVDKLVSGLK